MWGSGRFGEMLWGGTAVPTLPIGMLLLLMVGCFLAGGYFLRPGRRGPRGYIAAAILFLVPLSVGALTLPFSFVNGTVADATQVNANFAALASAVEDPVCPAGMTSIALAHSTLCYATGPISVWAQASAYCSDQFRARLCSVQQWRDAICAAGLTNPGASWTGDVSGTSSFGVVSGCSPEQVTSSAFSVQRVATCCLEWARY